MCGSNAKLQYCNFVMKLVLSVHPMMLLSMKGLTNMVQQVLMWCNGVSPLGLGMLYE